ncbi:MAG TPA: hypothetical protein DCZ72_15675 [Armatimonadetes bacterium]|mgnify:CR=1 FL=1|nr:hypothetical protein [Armatimonadota bacterium]
MNLWLGLGLVVAVVWLGLAVIDLRYRRHWEQLSWEARMRAADEALTVARASLGRLAADRAAGKFEVPSTYARLFDNLTRAGDRPEG